MTKPGIRFPEIIEDSHRAVVITTLKNDGRGTVHLSADKDAVLEVTGKDKGNADECNDGSVFG